MTASEPSTSYYIERDSQGNAEILPPSRFLCTSCKDMYFVPRPGLSMDGVINQMYTYKWLPLKFYNREKMKEFVLVYCTECREAGTTL